jgi:hypothetical protein
MKSWPHVHVESVGPGRDEAQRLEEAAPDEGLDMGESFRISRLLPPSHP